MKDVVFTIITILLLVAGCFFVNDTKDKHGVCCGKGCAGCKVFEEDRKRKNQNNT